MRDIDYSPNDEIISEEMIDAGYDALRETVPDWTDVTPAELVEAALRRSYLAMKTVKKRQQDSPGDQVPRSCRT